ncbi:hypothetical protein [Candidatus Rhabdochlamydia sp. T3358]|jgi:hypothetical protein|uniref:hypothetical protein n=1 Tax=Candidatus Rhabdochlamydia sp. T3358 TaxID=2099795 RepID=UPI0010B97823|nr:hypothetical protein [Candidatus Rhabdochlamydia sp. T3358]VHO03978.1 hypothetical protein RHT_01142 [Candidatus Rhabdochlamydia sp. T3358]
MSIDFRKEVFHPRTTTLTAIGGCIAGRFCRISPLHGAIYAVVSRIAYQIAYMINDTVFTKFYIKLSELKIKKSFKKLMVTPLMMSSAYLGYTAGNKALSLIGRRIAFETAIKVSLVSGVTGFFSGLLIDFIRR